MWKKNWDATRQHFIDWWNHEGFVIGGWGAPVSEGEPHEATTAPPDPESLIEWHTDGAVRAQRNHHALAQRVFPADTLPISVTDIGPGSLALFLGSEPGFSPQTVWFNQTIRDSEAPEDLPAFEFDESNEWWKVTETTLKACAELGTGKYMVGCPDLIENIDILASLRDSQTLLMDMVERPEWVEQKLSEINQVWFEAYDRIYDIIKLEDGSSAFGAFRIWGPGKVAKVQCDASAMFSPDMFRRFVVPSLAEQCEWLDHSMFHLDGSHCICHLDALLEIDALDAVEWTPDPTVPGSGDPCWYDMYRKILDAGKSLQVLGVKGDALRPLFDAIGSKGVYILSGVGSQAEADEITALADEYR